MTKGKPLWVVDFRCSGMTKPTDGPPCTTVHHCAQDGHEDWMDTDLASALPVYDMVLNGWELGGGSVRIHQADVQTKAGVQRPQDRC
jgi:aspartyl-tRNA synthetase